MNATVEEIRKWSTTKSRSAHIKPVWHKKLYIHPHWPLDLPPSDLKLQKHATAADPRNTVQSSESQVNASLIRPTIPVNLPPGKPLETRESNPQK